MSKQLGLASTYRREAKKKARVQTKKQNQLSVDSCRLLFGLISRVGCTSQGGGALGLHAGTYEAVAPGYTQDRIALRAAGQDLRENSRWCPAPALRTNI